MTNKKGARGEGILEVDGQQVPVLFTNRALAMAEQASGKSILGIVEGFEQGTSGMTELAHLLRVGMDAARQEQHLSTRSISMKDVWDVIDALGMTQVMPVVMEAVADVIAYDPTDEKVVSDPNL